jgi:hypothetical protein
VSGLAESFSPFFLGTDLSLVLRRTAWRGEKSLNLVSTFGSCCGFSCIEFTRSSGLIAKSKSSPANAVECRCVCSIVSRRTFRTIGISCLRSAQGGSLIF